MSLLAEPAASVESVVAVLKSIKTHCSEKPVKLLIGNNGGLAVLLAGCERYTTADAIADATLAGVTTAAFEALCALLFEQPDLAGPVQVVHYAHIPLLFFPKLSCCDIPILGRLYRYNGRRNCQAYPRDHSPVWVDQGCSHCV